MKKGDRVRLKKGSCPNHVCPKGRQNNRTAVIQGEMDDYCEGAVFMDRDLRGCRYWNKSVLELA